MNYNTLSGSAKLYKKLETYSLGQEVTSGEVPNIAIISTVDAAANKRLVESVEYGVRSLNGTVKVFSMAEFGQFNKINPMTAKYAAGFRKVSAQNAEAIIRTNLIDGVVAITDCDITAAGIIEGAAKVNCPILLLPTGVNLASIDSGRRGNLQVLGAAACGKLNSRQSEEMIKNAFVPQCLSNDFDSASTFFVLAEAMGFCVPGASCGLLNSGGQYRNAVATGAQIYKSAKDFFSSKKLLTRGSLGNAMALCLAIGGEIGALNLASNLVKNYEPQIAHGLIAEYSVKVPLLLSGENQNCSVLREIGIFPILKQLASSPKLIDESALTYSGEKLKNTLAATESANQTPVSNNARIILVKGSAAEHGGYVQPAKHTPASFSGKAWVYDGLEAADKALLANSIPTGSILVVHNCVDTYVTSLAYAIEGMQKQNEIAVITDGLCEKTSVLVVTRCTPDSLSNEEFANIQNGDTLEIDLSRGRINTNILSKEQKSRAKKNSVKKQQFFFVN